MPARYAECVESIVRGSPRVKPADIEELVLARLHLAHNNRPADFPTVSQLKGKVATMKYKVRREHGI